jgi:hypothetical protein
LTSCLKIFAVKLGGIPWACAISSLKATPSSGSEPDVHHRANPYSAAAVSLSPI